MMKFGKRSGLMAHSSSCSCLFSHNSSVLTKLCVCVCVCSCLRPYVTGFAREHYTSNFPYFNMSDVMEDSTCRGSLLYSSSRGERVVMWGDSVCSRCLYHIGEMSHYCQNASQTACSSLLLSFAGLYVLYCFIVYTMLSKNKNHICNIYMDFFIHTVYCT